MSKLFSQNYEIIRHSNNETIVLLHCKAKTTYPYIEKLCHRSHVDNLNAEYTKKKKERNPVNYTTNYFQWYFYSNVPFLSFPIAALSTKIHIISQRMWIVWIICVSGVSFAPRTACMSHRLPTGSPSTYTTFVVCRKETVLFLFSS